MNWLCAGAGSAHPRKIREVLSQVGVRIARALLAVSGSCSPVGPAPLVRLVDRPCRPAATPFERLVVVAIARAGRLPYPALVERVADQLYRQELRCGGWATDIGVWGNRRFFSEVERELHDGDGVLWTTEPTKSRTPR